MTVKTQSTVDMLTNVVDFGAQEFSPDSAAGKAFTAIGSALSNMSKQSTRQAELLGQARVATSGRVAAREAFRGQLDAISRAAQAVAVDIVGVDRKFRTPDFPRRDKGMIQAGETFAKAAAPLKEKFIENHLP